MTSDSTPAAGEVTIRVMIVDDHPVVRDGLRGMFEREPDIEVVAEAASGPEALARIDALRGDGPQVVLMDLRMPGGDGIQAIRRLRQEFAGPWPAVLVLTTYDAERDVRAAMEAGANGFLLKDTGRTDLVRAVRDVAAGRPVITAQALAVLTGHREEATLTARELEVLRVIAAGGTNRSAARQLMVSEATVKTHLLHAYEKLGVSDRAAAVRVAYERNLL